MNHDFGSKGTSKNINNTDKWRRIPFNSDGAINLIIPITRSRQIKPAISFLHDDAVGNKFEIFIDISNWFKNLSHIEMEVLYHKSDSSRFELSSHYKFYCSRARWLLGLLIFEQNLGYYWTLFRLPSFESS